MIHSHIWSSTWTNTTVCFESQERKIWKKNVYEIRKLFWTMWKVKWSLHPLLLLHSKIWQFSHDFVHLFQSVNRKLDTSKALIALFDLCRIQNKAGILSCKLMLMRKTEFLLCFANNFDLFWLNQDSKFWCIRIFF